MKLILKTTKPCDPFFAVWLQAMAAWRRDGLELVRRWAQVALRREFDGLAMSGS